MKSLAHSRRALAAGCQAAVLLCQIQQQEKEEAGSSSVLSPLFRGLLHVPAVLVHWETSWRSWGSCKAVPQIGSHPSWRFPPMQGCFGCLMSTSGPWCVEKPIFPLHLQLLLTAAPPDPANSQALPFQLVFPSPPTVSHSPPGKPCNKIMHELTKLKMKRALCGSDPTPGHAELWPGSTPALVAAGPACVIQSSFLHEACWFSTTREPSAAKSC